MLARVRQVLARDEWHGQSSRRVPTRHQRRGAAGGRRHGRRSGGPGAGAGREAELHGTPSRTLSELAGSRARGQRGATAIERPKQGRRAPAILRDSCNIRATATSESGLLMPLTVKPGQGPRVCTMDETADQEEDLLLLRGWSGRAIEPLTFRFSVVNVRCRSAQVKPSFVRSTCNVDKGVVIDELTGAIRQQLVHRGRDQRASFRRLTARTGAREGCSAPGAGELPARSQRARTPGVTLMDSPLRLHSVRRFHVVMPE